MRDETFPQTAPSRPPSWPRIPLSVLTLFASTIPIFSHPKMRRTQAPLQEKKIPRIIIPANICTPRKKREALGWPDAAPYSVLVEPKI